MKHYYLSNPNSPKGFDEVTEEEFYAILGDETTKPYAGKVYRGELTIEEVPEDIREAVIAVVEARTARFGVYTEQDISAEELKNMIQGVL